MFGGLIVNNGKQRENPFNEAQVTKLVGGCEFAFKFLALGGRYGKTKAQHLVISLRLTLWKMTNRRKHCQMLTYRQADGLFRAYFKDPFS